MAWQSTLYPGEEIMHSYGHPLAKCPPGMSKGHRPRDYAQRPLGSLAAAPALNIPLLTDDEIRAKAQVLETSKARISDVLLRNNIAPLDQNGTSNCWANGPTGCAQDLRAVQGLPYVKLSPAFIATTLGEFNGGNGSDALQVLAEKGAPTTDLFGANDNGGKITDEVLANAKLHRVEKWWDIPSGGMREVATCVLSLGVSCAVGYDGWGHEVRVVDIFIGPNGEIWPRIRNSWGDWGYKGFAILGGSIGIPDDACCPYAILPDAA